MNISAQKIVLKTLLKKAGLSSISFEYIFETDKIKTDIAFELDSFAFKMIKNKLKSLYPNGKFIQLKISETSLKGSVLFNDGTKDEINTNF